MSRAAAAIGRAVEHVTPPVSRFGARKPQVSAAASRDELAILRAVVYASLFEFPLTLEETRRTLVRCVVSAQELLEIYAHSPFLQERIELREGLFVPAGRAGWIAERRARERRSRAMLERDRRVLNLLCALPFVRMIAVSGSLAHLNATGAADVDLFVIASRSRVWTVTASIVLISKMLGVRRTICANYVVADSHLALEPQDEFAANQMLHLRPIVGASMYPEFINANPCVREIYRNADTAEARPPIFAPAPWTSALKRALERLCDLPAALVEPLCRRVYGGYLRRKAARWPSPEQVRLEADCLKLHGHSHRQSIGGRFDAAMTRALFPTAGR